MDVMACQPHPVEQFTFLTKPWAHQVAALEFLSSNSAVLLDYEMGTGKTKIAVDWISNQVPGNHVIICPKKVIDVWASEFEAHCPVTHYLLTLSKTQTARKKADAVLQLLDWSPREPGPKVVVVNYETAWRSYMREVLLGAKWDSVILDESHRIKDPRGRASRFCLELGVRVKSSGRRICLTGTPLPHSPLDAFAQARFLDKEIFGLSFSRFRAHYAIMGGHCVNGRPVQILGFQNQDELSARLGRVTIAARTDEVLDLPDAHHISRPVTLSNAGLRHYKNIEKLFITWVKDEEITASNALVKLLRLQQITSGHLPKEGGGHETIDTSKRDALEEILSDLPSSEKVVVFCRFTADVAEVKAVAEEVGRKAAELSGRVNELELWKKDAGTTILASQIQAGKEGISLVEARYAIYYSLGFSLGDYIQSLARIRRPGQKACRCVYYHLVASGTVDEKVYTALQKRRDVVESILDDMRCTF